MVQRRGVLKTRAALVPARGRGGTANPRIPAAFTCLYSSPLCCLLVDAGVTRSFPSLCLPRRCESSSSLSPLKILNDQQTEPSCREELGQNEGQHPEPRPTSAAWRRAASEGGKTGEASCMCRGISCVGVNFLFSPVF